MEQLQPYETRGASALVFYLGLFQKRHFIDGHERAPWSLFEKCPKVNSGRTRMLDDS